tara:strand:- start:954 stop:2102 length:1149 start_codon:yes stop_codon:yes gene_type:complete
MKINIFGSTGTIGIKTIKIIDSFFPKIRINLLCANNNVNLLLQQANKLKPKFVYIDNKKHLKKIKNNLNSRTKILNYNELKSYLKENKIEFSLLAVSGYKSLKYFDLILKNSSSIGLVSKEAIVSGGHLFKKYNKITRNKIFPLDSEHFSIYKNLNSSNISLLKNLTLTASGGPFLGKKFFNLNNINFSQASSHPKWKMGYKNSIDSATLVNKCLEVIEAHYLFDIDYRNLKIIIHPESKIHSIFEFKNHLFNMVAFHNDMTIPIYHFLNQNFDNILPSKNYNILKNNQFNFLEVKKTEFPIYSYFNNLDKTNPINVINFNAANEYAVDLFKNKIITYTDIYKIIVKLSSLNLNYKLNNIKDILEYHEILKIKINEKIAQYI